MGRSVRNDTSFFPSSEARTFGRLGKRGSATSGRAYGYVTFEAYQAGKPVVVG